MIIILYFFENLYNPIQIRFAVVLSNDEVNSIDSFTYSPNPIRDFLKIDSKTNISSIIIFDMYGKVLMSHRNINKKSFEFDLSTLSSGTYFFKNIFGNRTETVKIIKK